MGSNGFGISPIGWPEIDAFCRHSGQSLAPWEIDVIEAIDDALIASLGDSKPESDQ